MTDDKNSTHHFFGGTSIIAEWEDIPWYATLRNAHHKVRGACEAIPPFLRGCWYNKDKVSQVTKVAGWNTESIEFIEMAEWVPLGTDIKRWVTLAWSFPASPVDGWQWRDEGSWDKAVGFIVKGLLQAPWHKVEYGVHKVRLVVTVAIMQKQE
ncbi:hypothetical protein F5Y14DRAFT_455565 [Nemania sp. NC0429]|nr:hypothetical protein F5Y14DRAFT_455562 [Nemania sp. NC0429]KAI1109901.1 hypothetical protein F5Y14DRAFT_455565 [Nemania sp. NC0429]